MLLRVDFQNFKIIVVLFISIPVQRFEPTLMMLSLVALALNLLFMTTKRSLFILIQFDHLTIEVPNGQLPNTIVIYNLLGSEVKRLQNTNTVNMSNLKGRVYLVKVRDDFGNSIIRKVIKKLVLFLSK